MERLAHEASLPLRPLPDGVGLRTLAHGDLFVNYNAETLTIEGQPLEAHGWRFDARAD